MTRLMVLTRDPDQVAAVGRHLEQAGGVVAGYPGPVITAILPMLGPVTVNCVLLDDHFDRLSTYQDAIGVVGLASAPNGEDNSDLESLIAGTRHHFAALPLVMGLTSPVTRPLADWIATSVGRAPCHQPIYQVDPNEQADLFVLLATALCMAHELSPQR